MRVLGHKCDVWIILRPDSEKMQIHRHKGRDIFQDLCEHSGVNWLFPGAPVPHVISPSDDAV